MATPAIPLDWSADAVLIDGTAITIRALRPGDRPALGRFYDCLDPESVRFRCGTTAVVRRISEIIEHGLLELLRDLAAAGVRTGVEVTVEADGSWGGVTLAVDDGLQGLRLDPTAARLIWVEVSGPSAGLARDRRPWRS